MKKFKIYLHLQNHLDEAIKNYANVFNAEIYKRNIYEVSQLDKRPELVDKIGQTYFAVLKFYGELMVLISLHSENYLGKFGISSSIIIFFDTDKDSFNKTYEKLQNNTNFKMDYDKDTWNSWGTQIVCFKDKWGIRWILELDVRKIDNNWNPKKEQ